MNYLCGMVAVCLVLGLVSAKPAADFGERVKSSLQSKGITLDKLLSSRDGFMQEQVGDIWSNCGKSQLGILERCKMFFLLHAGSSSDIGKIQDVNISPDPPKKGENITVDATVTLSMF